MELFFYVQKIYQSLFNLQRLNYTERIVSHRFFAAKNLAK